MSSNNYAVVVGTVDISAVVSGDDRMKPYYIYSTDDPGDIPDLPDIEMAATTLGVQVRNLVAIADKLRFVDWGNGHRGLCIHEGTHMQFWHCEEIMSYEWTEECGTCGELFVNSSGCTALECPDCQDKRRSDEPEPNAERLEDMEL